MSNIPEIKDKIVGLLESECCLDDADNTENNMSFVLCQNKAFDSKLLINVIDKKCDSRLYIELRLNLNILHWGGSWKRSFLFDDWIINPMSSFSSKPIKKILQRKNEILDFFTCCFLVSNTDRPELGYTESTLTYGGYLYAAIKKISLSFEEGTVNCGYPAITIEDFISMKDILCNKYSVSFETLSAISIDAQQHIAICQNRRREEMEKKKSKKKNK